VAGAQRYRVDDLPPSKVGAFMPIPTTTARSSAWGLVQVFGAPGTLAIPLDKPTDAYGTLSARGPGPNSTRGSDQMPSDVFFPNIYYASTANMGNTGAHRIGLARRRRAELPVPAISFTRFQRAVKYVMTAGSRYTQPWPRALQRYPTRRPYGDATTQPGKS
jgi:hypothetical protein